MALPSAEGGEPSAVESEDVVDVEGFREEDQRGIGIVQCPVTIESRAPVPLPKLATPGLGVVTWKLEATGEMADPLPHGPGSQGLTQDLSD